MTHNNKGLKALLQKGKTDSIEEITSNVQLAINHIFTPEAYNDIQKIMEEKGIAAKRKAINYAIEKYYRHEKRIKELENENNNLKILLRKMGDYFYTKNKTERLFSECSEDFKKLDI